MAEAKEISHVSSYNRNCNTKNCVSFANREFTSDLLSSGIDLESIIVESVSFSIDHLPRDVSEVP